MARARERAVLVARRAVASAACAQLEQRLIQPLLWAAGGDFSLGDQRLCVAALIQRGGVRRRLQLHAHVVHRQMLDLLRAQRCLVALGESKSVARQFPVAMLGAAGKTGALEPVMRPACTGLVGGLAAVGGLLSLRLTQAERLGGRLVGLARRSALGARGEKTQDGLDELIIGRHGHVRSLPDEMA